MSFLRRGERRRGKVAAALATVGALAAFQALAIVGAGAAFATGTCEYDLVTDTVEIEMDAGTFVILTVDGTTGAIEMDGVPCDTATNSNTVAIVVQGQIGSNEEFIIDEDSGEPFNTAIAWEIDLGTGTGNDHIDLALNGDQDNTVVFTNTSFNLNGALGVLAGIQQFFVEGGNGDDTVDASAASILVGLNLNNGDDTISPGTFDGDFAFGGNGDDTLNYGGRTSAMAVVNGSDAGTDANADGDNDDTGDEEDTIDCFERVVTGSGNDFIDGDCGGGNTYAPGLGDDDIVDENSNDTLDFSSSGTGPVTIDVDAQTATGEGADTWENLLNFIGTTFDDLMIGVMGGPNSEPPDNVDSFSGLAGTDTVDGSADLDGVRIDLDSLDPDEGDGPDDLENAIGGPGNDALRGNDLRNTLTGNAGDDTLRGRAANDTLIGGQGNDAFNGGDGADKVTFKTNTTAGVNVDISLGFATSSDSGDDTFEDLVEIIIGSQFKDTITGGPFGGGGTVNFLFKGLKKADVLTGFNGNDTLRGGPGGDTLRGVGGDDILKGAKGADLLAGGNGFDVGRGGPGNDDCRSIEDRQSC